MRKQLALLAMLMAILLLGGCGYNPIMYSHLSDPGNYAQYDVVLAGISYYDAEGTLCDYAQDSNIEHATSVFLHVIFSSKEELAPFRGVLADLIDDSALNNSVMLRIEQANNRVLYENGFYETVSLNADITVTTSNWIYMDGYFFYVTAVTCGGVEYLGKETGLANIIAMMDKDRSIL